MMEAWGNFAMIWIGFIVLIILGFIVVRIGNNFGNKTASKVGWLMVIIGAVGVMGLGAGSHK